MTRVFHASSLIGAAALGSAVDAGLFGERAERRVLIVSNDAPVPEVVAPLHASPQFDGLRGHFDEVVSWNDLIFPLHPAGWVPGVAETPMLQRLIAAQLGLADGVRELVVENPAVTPGRAICSLIPGCPVTAYATGLDVYGPPEAELPASFGNRVSRLMYRDLVATLQPQLLQEVGVATVAFPRVDAHNVQQLLPAPDVPADAHGCPLVIGDWLSAPGLLSPDEELGVYRRMMSALVAAGHRTIVFKPHPFGTVNNTGTLAKHLGGLGARLILATEAMTESWLAVARPSIVVSCFNEALLSARRDFDIPVATMGTELLLEKMTPYGHGDRIALTIADALLPTLRDDGSIDAARLTDIDDLIRAVAFCMQSTRVPAFRESAATFLAANGPDRYFKKRRLEKLGLIAPPPPPPPPTPQVKVGRAARRLLTEARTVTDRRRSGS